ncbi:MAG: S9 family peptidase [Bdellovibrionota bacterium]
MATESITLDANKLIDLQRVTTVSPSPCGTWAAVAVERLDASGAKYVSDLWRVSLSGSKQAFQLTRGDHSDTAPCFRQDGALGFLSNRPLGEGDAAEGEKDRMQVWVLPPYSADPERITDEPLGVQWFQFAKHADRLIVFANVLPELAFEKQRQTYLDRKKNGPSALLYKQMPVRYWDAWIPETTPHLIAYDGAGNNRKDLTPDATDEHRRASWDVSEDGKKVVISRLTMAADRMHDCAMQLIDIDTQAQQILGAATAVTLEFPKFSPDGRWLTCTHHLRSVAKAGKTDLALFDLQSTATDCTILTQDWDRSPMPADWSADSTKIIVTADDHGQVPVFEIDIASKTVTRITAKAAGGSHAGIRRVDQDKIIGIRSSLQHPPELFCAPLQVDAAPTLPYVLSGFSQKIGERIAVIENVAVPSTDGTPIHGIILKPPHPKKDKTPVLLWIHGGPMGAWGDMWHWRWNPLLAVEQGFTVALPNPRGSTGFGQDFVEGIWGNVWGKQCFEDVMAFVDHLETDADLDANNIAVMGGSFGGYMTNWIGSQTGDRFPCLITHASLYDMAGFYGVTDFPAFWSMFMGEPPFADPVAFNQYSPSRFVAHWKAPTLIIHGEKDYRVPVGEALHLFEALQHHGVDSQLLIYPDENHWILKPRNIVNWYESVFAFLDKHIKA